MLTLGSVTQHTFSIFGEVQKSLKYTSGQFLGQLSSKLCIWQVCKSNWAVKSETIWSRIIGNENDSYLAKIFAEMKSVGMALTCKTHMPFEARNPLTLLWTFQRKINHTAFGQHPLNKCHVCKVSLKT